MHRLSTAFIHSRWTKLVSLVLLVGIVSLTLPSVFRSQQVRADGPVDTLTIDAAIATGNPSYNASGFLSPYKSDGSLPPDDTYVTPLKPQEIRYGGDRYAGSQFNQQSGGTGAMDQRISALHVPHQELLVSSLWNDTHGYPNITNWPCDSTNDCSTWQQECTDEANHYHNSGLSIEYDIWNEPDTSNTTESYWQGGEPQFFQAWQTCYQAIRAVDPNAVIVGPSTAGPGPGYFNDFLSFAKQNNVLPNYVTYHCLPCDPATVVPSVNQTLANDGITTVTGQIINEYEGGSFSTAGEAYYMARAAHEQSTGLVASGHSCFGECEDGSFDTLLTYVNGQPQPNGHWWTYKRYADITGHLLGVTAGVHVDALAGADANTGQVRAIVGNDIALNGSNLPAGNVVVHFQNLNQTPYIFNGNTVQVTVEQLPNGNSAVSTLPVVENQAVSVANNAIDVTLPWTTTADAFAITLSAQPLIVTGNFAPAAISTQSGSLDIFARGTDNALWQQWYRNGSWSSSWAKVGGSAVLADSPAVASQGAQQYDLFFRGTDSQLYQISWTGSGWSAAAPLGGPTNNTFQGAPTAISTQPGSLDVFVRGTDNALYQRWYRNGNWSSSWANIGSPSGGLADSPGAASYNGNNTVFARGADGALWQISWTGNSWSSWTSLGGPTNNTFQGVPAAISTQSDSLDVFVRGTDNALWQRWYRNGSWSSSWANVGGSAVLADSPAVASQGAQQYDLFFRGTDSKFYQISWTGSGWSTAALLGSPNQ